jgi:hypothetical protein
MDFRFGKEAKRMENSENAAENVIRIPKDVIEAVNGRERL